MKWYIWAGLGIGAWWLLTRPKAASGAPMSQTMYDQLTQLAKVKFPTLTNISIATWGDGSMTFTGQGIAPDNKSYITVKMFTAKNPDDALAKINAGVLES